MPDLTLGLIQLPDLLVPGGRGRGRATTVPGGHAGAQGVRQGRANPYRTDADAAKSLHDMAT
eukprot:8907272-Pyramimonas_sp.AAC.1